MPEKDADDLLLEQLYGAPAPSEGNVRIVDGVAIAGPDATAEEQHAAMLAMERASVIPSSSERMLTAYYLIRVALNLLEHLPHVHVRIEAAGKLVMATVTRQQYPHGHPLNDAPLKPELFDPTKMEWEPFKIPLNTLQMSGILESVRNSQCDIYKDVEAFTPMNYNRSTDP